MELINYSHIPVAILSLLIGVFVFIKNRELISKILLMISVVFSMWLFLDLLIWTFGYNSYLTMFSWSILGIFFDLFFILSLYFFYVFVDKKDLDSFKKIILFSLLIPTIILTPTIYNLEIFSLVFCEAMEKGYFVGYYYFVGVVVSVWLLVLAFLRYRKANDEFKKQILLMTIGMGLLLVSFSWANIIGSLTLDWKIIQYGFFGMPIFLGFLTYLIIRFKAFEIKLIGVQALVFILIILIGSQFTFIKNNVNRILTAITLLLATTFGWILVRSVKKAIQQKEALEMAYGEIENRNKKLNIANKENIHQKNQLQKLSNNLIKANIELKKLDEAKSDFVSMASHQLRTPPTPIKGYSSMLLEGAYGKLNSEQARAVENINKANNQQIEFVEDLLSVSRIESGSTKFEFKKQQIGTICQEIVDNLTFKAKEKNIFLKYEIPATPLPEIDIDGMKIREVLSNLIDNAIKYTQKGGVTVSTKLYIKKICVRGTKCLKKPHIRITISDTGIGIPANEIPYLFIKFSRGKDISRLNTGGTGLGLYVVKIITAANGGKVWIESPGANKGTKFILELPLEQEKKSAKRVGKGE
jgi:signal transduction histidine kinase